MIDQIQVGKKIKEERLNRGLTQDELSASLNISRQALSKWETGISLPPIEAVVELVRLLNMSIEELLCLNKTVPIDKDNLFVNHSRLYVMDQLLKDKIDIKLEEVFYQLSKQERMRILHAIREGKMKRPNQFHVYLNEAEKKFLYGNKRRNYDDCKKNDD
jgi:transcriptional regulator with XRE-family HTH domain